MAIQFDGVAMPASMSTRGDWKFPPPEILDYDGIGRPIVASTRTATWTWRQLNQAEATWILTTFLGGQSSRVCDNGLRLYDPLAGMTETAFAYAVVDRPTWEEIVSGVYSTVALTIRDIR